MSLSRTITIAVWFALLQWCTNKVRGNNVHITCPKIPVTESSSPVILPFQSNLNTLSLNSSCFAIDIALNVENILPSPSYISAGTNTRIIADALQKTLNDDNIYGLSINYNALDADAEWSTVNQCPHQSDETVNKFYFETVSYDITCDEQSVKVVDDFIECDFRTPPSLAYEFVLQSANVKVAMRTREPGLQSMNMEALIYNKANGELMADVQMMATNLNANQVQQFVFPAAASEGSTILLEEEVFVLKIRVMDVLTGNNGLQLNDSLPVVSTIATPNACQLGYTLAVSDDMDWALWALCYEPNAEQRSLFERTLYQQHSSQTLIPGAPVRRRTMTHRSMAKMHPEGRDSKKKKRRIRKLKSQGNHNSLHKLYEDGENVQIADDIIAPDYSQCIAVDPDTLRIFSVGGHSKSNGAALNRLVVHRIDPLDTAQLVGSLSLDRARSGALCHYWKNIRDNEEYIIVINGMNQANNPNIDDWFNDIVFIPLNPENEIKFPEITLAHNVIDMKTYITETDQLYLIGGRNGYNAVNYIQSIDLEHVLAAATATNANTVHAEDRMEPMVFDLVRPFVDVVDLSGEPCFMIFGGQNVINNEWIDTQIPSRELQLICNISNFDTFTDFTAFDVSHLLNVPTFDDRMKESNDIFITNYDFADDDIWYEFGASFKVCGIGEYSEEYLTKTMNALETDNGVLRDNILSESQKQFKDWNQGFSDLNIADINFIRTPTMRETHDHCFGLSHSVCDGLRITGNGGDQSCGYNPVNGDCYAIQRVSRGYGDYGTIDSHNHNNAYAFETLVQWGQLPLVVVLIMSNIILVLSFVSCVVFARRNKRNDQYTIHNGEMQQTVEVGAMDGRTTTNTIDDIDAVSDEEDKLMFTEAITPSV